MVVLPIVRSAWTKPLLLPIVAMDVSDEAQKTWVVISLVVPSEYVPVAVSAMLPCKVKNGLAGVIVMNVRGTGTTVRVVLPEIFGVLVIEVAVMVVLPAATAVARPVLLTVATVGSEEVQLTTVVISKLVVSEYVPVALNCWVSPTNMVGLGGVTAMESRVAVFTVRVALPEIPGGLATEVAVMVVVPAKTATARPVLSIVATVGADEVQVACVGKVVPSEYVPMAVNFMGTPTGMFRLAAVTVRDCRVAVFTVRSVLPEIEVFVMEVAVTVVDPMETAEARPVPSIVATDGVDEVQVTCVVKSTTVPLLNVPMAANC